MMELSLKIGEEVDMQNVSNIMFGISSILSWVFFIIVALVIGKYIIKKENALPSKKKHSQSTRKRA